MGSAGDYRFWEATLRRGDRVSVFGHVSRTAVPHPGGYRDATIEHPMLSGADAQPLVLTRALDAASPIVTS